MAHNLQVVDGQYSFAQTGNVPAWHGLGQFLSDNASIAEWKAASGFDFTVVAKPIMFNNGKTGLTAFPDKVALHHSGTGTGLAIVSESFKIVQPGELFDFIYEACREANLKMETAGVLFDGQKYWVQASTGDSFKIGGNDLVRQFVMFATACDGSMKSIVKNNATRVVCNNTLTVALGETGCKQVAVSHRSKFNPFEVASQMGLMSDAWASFRESANLLAETPVIGGKDAVKSFLCDVFGGDKTKSFDEQKNKQAMQKTWEQVLHSPGSDLQSAKGTLWGLLNGVTRFVDFERRSRSDANRFDAAQFGEGDKIKTKAFEACMKMAMAA